MATHSSFLACRICWIKDLEGYSPWGGKESDTTKATEHRAQPLRAGAAVALGREKADEPIQWGWGGGGRSSDL